MGGEARLPKPQKFFKLPSLKSNMDAITTKENSDINQLLIDGIQSLNLTLPPTALQKIITYICLINKWNKVYNLTAARTDKELIVNHVLDSLSITPYIKGPEILDVGSGAGFPGVPLALALPQYNFTLLDCLNKRTRFLNQVIIELQLKNVTVIQNQIEQYHPNKYFNDIVTRATYSISDMIEKVKHLCCNSTRLLMMKGKYPQQELLSITTTYTVHELQVPGLDAERNLIEILNF